MFFIREKSIVSKRAVVKKVKKWQEWRGAELEHKLGS